jgi:predicted transposase YbfD/YdcC
VNRPDLPPESIIECLQDLPDPRMERSRDHKLVDILVIGLCATLTVGDNFTDMEAFGKAKEAWLRTFLELPNGIPSHDTFNRVFSAIDPDAFLECFTRWTRGICTAMENEIVAIDGKALRHALNEGDRIPYIVSAWAARSGLTLGQVKVDEKSNEITAIPELLRVLELKGCIVTIDAMGTQKAIARQIVEAGGSYVLALKENHETAHAEFETFFNDAVPQGADGRGPRPEGMDFHETIDKGHGRVEIRRYWHTQEIDWFEDKKQWTGLRSAGMVESTRIQNGQRSTQRRIYLCTLERDAALLGEAVRGHWGVENPLHWVLDVIFREDESRARNGNAAQNLATTRRIALNLAKKETVKTSIRQKRIRAALDDGYRERMLGIKRKLDA